MSKQNKVNKGNYDQAPLTPDDMAREREESGADTSGAERPAEARRTGVQPGPKRARRMSVTTAP